MKEASGRLWGEKEGRVVSTKGGGGRSFFFLLVIRIFVPCMFFFTCLFLYICLLLTIGLSLSPSIYLLHSTFSNFPISFFPPSKPFPPTPSLFPYPPPSPFLHLFHSLHLSIHSFIHHLTSASPGDPARCVRVQPGSSPPRPSLTGESRPRLCPVKYSWL